VKKILSLIMTFTAGCSFLSPGRSNAPINKAPEQSHIETPSPQIPIQDETGGNPPIKEACIDKNGDKVSGPLCNNVITQPTKTCPTGQVLVAEACQLEMVPIRF